MGGSGLTASVAAARAGASVALVSYVGEEDAPTVLSMLRRTGVDTEAVAVLPGASGIFVFAADHDDQVPQPRYRPAETVPLVLPKFASAATILIFGIPEVDPLVDSSVAAAMSTNGTLIWDRQGQLSLTRGAAAAAALPARRRVYLANRREATDEYVLNDSNGSVDMPPGFDAAVIKDGVRGSLVIERSEARIQRSLVPAFAISVLNSIGSGDVFAGVFAAALSKGETISDAALKASAGASAVLASGHNIAPPDLPELIEGIAAGPGQLAWRWPV